MHTIDIDQNVYKALEEIASSSGEDYSTILRRLLSLTPSSDRPREQESNTRRIRFTDEENADPAVRDRFEALKAFLLALGDDVQMIRNKDYFAFKRGTKNFCCVQFYHYDKKLILMVNIAPRTVALEDGFTADKRFTGHFGTGHLEITIGNNADFEKAKPLLVRSYAELK